jgi:hypothetical protein
LPFVSREVVRITVSREPYEHEIDSNYVLC